MISNSYRKNNFLEKKEVQNKAKRLFDVLLKVIIVAYLFMLILFIIFMFN